MSHPPQAPNQQYGPPSYGPPPGQPQGTGAGLAIASMVLGIIALLISWVPIVNNVAAIIAVVGIGLGIPALIGARRGTRGGTGMAIAGLVTSVLAIVVVILTQMLFVAAIDEVTSSLEKGAAASATAPAEPSADGDAAETPDVVPLGVPAQVGDYEVTVDVVELDGNATVAAGNEYNEPPTGQYVVTQLTATYRGTDEGMPGFDLTAIFHGTDNRQYRDSECSALLPDDAMDAPTLNSGGSDTFQFCMDVPPAAIAGGQLSVEPTMSFEDERVFYAIG